MTPIHRSTIVTALLIATVTGTGPALAGGYGYGGYYGGHGYGHGGYYGGHYGYGHGGHYYGRHHGGDVGVAAATGIVFGMILSSAIHDSNDRRYRRPAYYDDTYRRPVTPPRVRYRRQPVYIAQRSASPCLQEREYQTHVTVNGHRVEAYGTACLQRDGSWRQGPPRLVPQF